MIQATKWLAWAVALTVVSGLVTGVRGDDAPASTAPAAPPNLRDLLDQTGLLVAKLPKEGKSIYEYKVVVDFGEGDTATVLIGITDSGKWRDGTPCQWIGVRADCVEYPKDFKPSAAMLKQILAANLDTTATQLKAVEWGVYAWGALPLRTADAETLRTCVIWVAQSRVNARKALLPFLKEGGAP